MAWYSDLAGTTNTTLLIGTANIWKAITGGFALRNLADSADAKIQASTLEASNDSILINYDATSSANDWTLSLARNPAQTAALTLQAPPAKGTDGFFLRQKAGTGAGILELELAAASGSANQMTVDTTSLAFGTASPLTLFSTPSGAVIHKVEVIVDTNFTGGTPTVTIGISGTTSKYMSSAQNILTGGSGNAWESNPKLASTAGESLIATYSAGGASAGAARILVYYSVPS
jgi:hypothetical protein